MKSYLNKLFTGYSLVKREVGGKNFQFRYKGKFTFFDPLLMIKECQYRFQNTATKTHELLVSIQKIQNLFPEITTESKPTVICEFKKGDEIWQVSRFSLKHENRKLSYYRFEVDSIFKGALYRVYDNGNFTTNYSLKIASAQNSTVSLSSENNCWTSMSGEEIFIEKFGHTQIWIWTNPIFSSSSIEV